MNTIKQQVNELNLQGNSHRDIAKICNIAPSTVHYHLNPQSVVQKERIKAYKRQWDKHNQKRVLHGENRVQHPFRVVSYYANGNAKKVMGRNGYSNLYSRLTPSDIFSLAKKQKCRCVLTGKKLEARTISVDHIVPLSKGGRNDRHNSRLVHIDVNRIKLDYTDIEFFNLCKSVVQYNSL